MTGDHFIHRLWNRIQRVRRSGGRIYCIRLYQQHKDSYFIRDSLGCEWDWLKKVPKYLGLLNELNSKSSDDDIVDIIISIDGPWIVLRKTNFAVC